MAIHNIFMDWATPALPATATYFAERYAAHGVLDGQQAIVVVPGARAGRRLLELLVDHADARQLALIPPQIVTMGQLPELLYDPPRPFASALTQHMAWVTALRATAPQLVAPLTHALPAAQDFLGWCAFAERLATVHYELAGEGLSCAEVARRGPSLATFRDTERWQALAAVQARYLDVLEAQGVWDPPTARRWALDNGTYQTTQDILLVGTVDLTATQRAMLDQVAERVTALIFAPPALADRFDAYGCLLTQAWQEAPIDLDAAEIAIVDTPGEQADAVVRTIAGYQGAFAAEDITIGVPDPRVLPYVQQRLTSSGLPWRYGVGTPVAFNGPVSAVAGHRRLPGRARLCRLGESGPPSRDCAMAGHPGDCQ